MRERAEMAEQRADTADEERRAAQARVERAEARAEAERERAEAATAAERRRAVEADAEQRRADKAEEALAAERVRVEGLQRDLAEHLSMATAAAYGLETVRLRAVEAEQAADALRQAEAARKGRGRLARLRAAWRGE